MIPDTNCKLVIQVSCAPVFINADSNKVPSAIKLTAPAHIIAYLPYIVMRLTSELRDHLLHQPPSFKKKKEYVLEELLGRGAFGKVVRATWTPPGREPKDVALKYVYKSFPRMTQTTIYQICIDLV